VRVAKAGLVDGIFGARTGHPDAYALQRRERYHLRHPAVFGSLSRRQSTEVEQLGGKQQLGLPLEVCLGQTGLKQHRVLARCFECPNHEPIVAPRPSQRWEPVRAPFAGVLLPRRRAAVYGRWILVVVTPWQRAQSLAFGWSIAVLQSVSGHLLTQTS